jgi:hypothetical protein
MFGMGGRSWCCGYKFDWTKPETIMVYHDLLFSSYFSRWVSTYPWYMLSEYCISFYAFVCYFTVT